MSSPHALGKLSGQVTTHGVYRLLHMVSSASGGSVGGTSPSWRVEILEGDIATLQLSALEGFALLDVTRIAPRAGAEAVRVVGGLAGRQARLEITRRSGAAK